MANKWLVWRKKDLLTPQQVNLGFDVKDNNPEVESNIQYKEVVIKQPKLIQTTSKPEKNLSPHEEEQAGWSPPKLSKPNMDKNQILEDLPTSRSPSKSIHQMDRQEQELPSEQNPKDLDHGRSPQDEAELIPEKIKTNIEEQEVQTIKYDMNKVIKKPRLEIPEKPEPKNIPLLSKKKKETKVVKLKPPEDHDQPKPKRSYRKKKIETSTNNKKINNISNYFKPKITTTIEDNPSKEDNLDVPALVPTEAGLSTACTNDQLLEGRYISVSDYNKSEDIIFGSNPLSNSDSDSISNFQLQQQQQCNVGTRGPDEPPNLNNM